MHNICSIIYILLDIAPSFLPQAVFHLFLLFCIFTASSQITLSASITKGEENRIDLKAWLFLKVSLGSHLIYTTNSCLPSCVYYEQCATVTRPWQYTCISNLPHTQLDPPMLTRWVQLKRVFYGRAYVIWGDGTVKLAY